MGHPNAAKPHDINLAQSGQVEQRSGGDWLSSVLCATLADVFDNEVDPQCRADLFDLIRETPLLRWMLLTKRIDNVAKMVPADWPFPHVGLMATIVNQEERDRNYPKLAAVPAPWRGISTEPMLGPIDIGITHPNWIITGGESGPGHRVIDPAWVRSIRDQCARSVTTTLI